METGQTSKRDINLRLIAVIWIVSTILIVVIVLAVNAFYLATEQSQAARYPDASVFSMTDLRAEQQARLSNGRWIDAKHQVVAIPINQAMEIMVQTKGRFPSTQPTTQPR